MSRSQSGGPTVAVFLVACAAVAVVAGAAAFGVVAWVGPRTAGGGGTAVDRAHAALVAAQRDRGDRLSLAAQLLAAEPALQAVLEDVEEAEDGAAALADLIAQRREDLGIDFALVLDPAGRVVAAGGGAGEAAGEDLSRRPLVARGMVEGAARGTWSDGTLLAWVAMERVAPAFDLRGHVVTGVRLDELDALDLAGSSGAAVTLVAAAPAGPRLVASSLEGPVATGLLEALSPAGGALGDALSSGEPREAPEVTVAGQRRRALVVPLATAEGARPAAAVVLSTPIGGSLLVPALAGLAAAAGAALVLALGLSLLVGRRAGEPARRLTEAVDAASGEGFARRLEPGRYRVLAPLAASLDRLFRRLGEERALTAAAAASRRRAESPAAAEEEALDLALVAVDLRRFARLADPREAGARLERDRARIAAAVEARGGRLVAAAGHRVLAAFDGDGAAWRAVTAGAAAVVAAGERESAFDEGEAPAAAVARGKGAVAAGTLVGPVVQLAESLLREAAPGDLTLARGVHGEVAGALSEQGLEASSQRGVLSPQPVFVLRGDALAAMAGGGATAGRGAAGTRPVPGSLFADRFEVLAREGSHGGVELLRAQDRELGLEVGLKWLPAGEGSSGGDALLESVRRLGHPHLARTFDVGASDGGRYLVREWVEGVAASRLGELPRPAALAFGRQLAGALAAVHREGLFHGRIKPENVFLEADGRVRVTDLGAGMVAGTAPSATAGDHLLAPEQEAGARGDARSDVYAMGALLHRLALAAWPGEPVAEEEGTAELAGVLARATAADPAARWADGGELLRALEGVTA